MFIVNVMTSFGQLLKRLATKTSWLKVIVKWLEKLHLRKSHLVNGYRCHFISYFVMKRILKCPNTVYTLEFPFIFKKTNRSHLNCAK